MLLILVLIAPAVPAGALALSNADPLFYANLDDAGFEFEYIPPANSEYSLYLFSSDGGDVHALAEIWENGEIIASGEGHGALCSAWLVAGTTYTMRVRGNGSAVVEVARSALSRCYDTPLPAEENVRSEKMIAHAFDAHWYRFEAVESGRMMLSCVPQDAGLYLSAMLFDDAGALISRFNSLAGGACMLLMNTKAGQNYYVRAYSPMGQEGYYAFNLHRSGESSINSAVRFARETYALTAGSGLKLAAEVEGEALLWDSDAPDVAAVGQDGTVRGLRAGEANITAYGISSQATCRVTVDVVPLESANIASERLELAVGDEVDVQIEFTPENASNRRLRYQIDDPEIASASKRGVLKGLSAGETTLRVLNANGEEMDSAQVVVVPAPRRYRALLVSEQSYPFSENPERKGSENSVRALESLLESGRFESAAYVADVQTDLSRAELIAAIRNAFRDATEQDVSLFYITCHGSYTGGMSFLELSDGSSLAVRDLERELRAVAGTVVVLIDCCGSGGSIGAASDQVAFAKGVTGAFSGAAIRGSKYKVLASAALDEDSFRIAFNEDADSGVMATVFARALCDGAGWNIDLDARSTMGADRNYDDSITLNELYLYMRDRVNWYLDIASGLTGERYSQSVQLYPEGDPFTIFERKS